MFKRHPAARIAALTLATIVLSTTAASAAAGTINASDVKFRTQPDTRSAIVDVLGKDTPLDIIRKDGDWYHVNRGADSGYVYAQYVTVVEDNTPSLTGSTAETPKVQGTVNADDVKFRIGPDTSFEIIRVLPKSTPVTAIQSMDTWQKVSIDGVEGYVFGTFITLAPSPAEKIYGERIRYVNANSLNIRAMPTAESEKLGELFRRNPVSEITTIAGWSRVRTKEGITGYILSDYLVDTEAAISRGNEEKVERLLKIAQTFLGVRYVHGGYSMKGTDCSGFVKMAFAKIGVTTPRSSSAYASAGVKVARENLRPGDVVTFDIRNNGNIGHVGIYLGGDQFIHASSTKGKVVIARFSTYNEKYMGARRFIR